MTYSLFLGDLETLERIFARYSIPIPWQPGDFALLDDITWPHARPLCQPRGERTSCRTGAGNDLVAGLVLARGREREDIPGWNWVAS